MTPSTFTVGSSTWGAATEGAIMHDERGQVREEAREEAPRRQFQGTLPPLDRLEVLGVEAQHVFVLQLGFGMAPRREQRFGFGLELGDLHLAVGFCTQLAHAILGLHEQGSRRDVGRIGGGVGERAQAVRELPGGEEPLAFGEARREGRLGRGLPEPLPCHGATFFGAAVAAIE